MIIKLSDFKQDNFSNTFHNAMNFLRENPNSSLTIEPGMYYISTDIAKNAQLSVMEGLWGSNPEKIMFNTSYEYSKGLSIEGLKNCKIIAYGVTILVDGFMEPISVTDCENIEIQGFTIDHVRKPYSKGIVKQIIKSNKEDVYDYLINLDKECPIMKKTPINLRQGFFNKNDNRIIHCKSKAEYIGEYQIRIKMPLNNDIKIGSEYYTIHTYHSRPAILLERNNDVRLKDITIHSQPGMGIVGNRCENVLLSGVCIVPSVGEKWSTNTDATHFTSIKGTLRYENCKFEGQGDDSANIHNYYHKIIQKESTVQCIIKENTPSGTHAQTLDYPDIGDIIELTNIKTLQTVDTYKVLESFPNFKEMNCRIVLDHNLPQDTEDLVFADITRLPNLEIVNCYAERHFARGFLIKCRNALIEGNTLKNILMSGIAAAAESYWYEGVTPSNITIRRNRIIDCGTGITVKSDCPNPEGQSIFNVRIEDNIIDCPTADFGIFVQNVDKLHISRNQIKVNKEPILIIDCTNLNTPIEKPIKS